MEGISCMRQEHNGYMVSGDKATIIIGFINAHRLTTKNSPIYYSMEPLTWHLLHDWLY